MTSFLVVVATKMVVKKNRKSHFEVAKTGRDFFWSWSRPIWAKKVGRDFLVRCNQVKHEKHPSPHEELQGHSLLSSFIAIIDNNKH